MTILPFDQPFSALSDVTKERPCACASGWVTPDGGDLPLTLSHVIRRGLKILEKSPNTFAGTDPVGLGLFEPEFFKVGMLVGQQSVGKTTQFAHRPVAIPPPETLGDVMARCGGIRPPIRIDQVERFQVIRPLARTL